MGRAVLIALALHLASAAPARADRVAVAEALYQEGRRLMDAGDYQAACPRFEESLRLDRGTGTLWHLARCYEKTGRLASAWARYHEVAQEARHNREPAKEKAALAAARVLEPRLHRLVIAVPEANRVEGLVVSRDGVDVGPGGWGAAIPLDTGAHQIRATAPGHRPWGIEVDIGGESRTARVEVPRLERVPALVPPGPSRDRPSPSRWYHDPVGWALVGGGVAVMAGGGFSLHRASAIEGDARAEPDLDQRDRLFDRSHNFRLAGTSLLVVGGAVAILGAVTLAIHDPGTGTEPAFQGSIDVRSGKVVLGIARRF